MTKGFISQAMRAVSSREGVTHVIGKIIERAAAIEARFIFAVKSRFAIGNELEAAARGPRDSDTPMPPSFLFEDM